MEALDVAKYVVTKCVNDKYPISNLQLQKILYYLQYEFLKKSDVPLFEDEFEAWKFGPVVPIVYYEYSYLGAFKIYRKYDNFQKTLSGLEKNMRDLINYVIKNKREVDAWKLVDQTHNQGKAWDKVFNRGLGFGDIISKEEIKTNAF